jgi:ankyrin repeat protein
MPWYIPPHPFTMSVLLAALRSSNHHLFNRSLSDPLTDVNEADDTGTTALMLAAYMGLSDEVAALLTHGANTSLTDKNGETALHIAAYNNRLGAVDHLLGQRSMDRAIVNKHGKTALVMAQEMEFGDICVLFEAIPDNNLCPVLIKALESNHTERSIALAAKMTPDTVNNTDADGWTPLMWACARGNVDVVRALLAIDGIDIMKASKRRESAYTVAPSYHIQRILRDAAEERAFKPTDSGTLTVYQKTIEQELCYGISRGCDDDVAKILSIPGLNINAVDKTYRSMGGKATALSQAAYQGDADVVEKLLNYPGIKVNIRDRIGRTPLMGAMETLCRSGNYERVVKRLVAHPATDLYATDNYGHSVLYHAKKEGATNLATIVRNAMSQREEHGEIEEYEESDGSIGGTSTSNSDSD